MAPGAWLRSPVVGAAHNSGNQEVRPLSEANHLTPGTKVSFTHFCNSEVLTHQISLRGARPEHPGTFPPPVGRTPTSRRRSLGKAKLSPGRKAGNSGVVPRHSGSPPNVSVPFRGAGAPPAFRPVVGSPVRGFNPVKPRGKHSWETGAIGAPDPGGELRLTPRRRRRKTVPAPATGAAIWGDSEPQDPCRRWKSRPGPARSLRPRRPREEIRKVPRKGICGTGPF